jgi:hypothetical protein
VLFRSNHGEAVRKAFRTRFLERFNHACRRDARRVQADEDMQLSLMDPDDLEERLACQSLATAISNACAEELYGLGQRIGLLIEDPDLIHGENPLGPEVIGATVIAALNDLDRFNVGIKIRLIVASLLNRSLPERVKEIYQTINRQLVKRGVLPTLRIGLKRIRHETQEVSATSSGQNAQARSEDVFATLRRLLSPESAPMADLLPIFAPQACQAAAGHAETPTGQSGQGTRAPATPVFAALDRLQRGLAAPEFGVDRAVLTDSGTNVLHGLRQSGLPRVMPPLDAMTLDIVALLFDFIFDDPRIPDAMKAPIGRLQIPILKVAMRDKAFFSHKIHPARQLLDALAEAAFGWNAEEGHDSDLYREVERLIQSVLDGYEDNLGVFVQAVTDLRTYLASEQAQAMRRADQSARVIHDRERVEHARQIAHDEVQTCLLGGGVPQVIAGYINHWWEPWLAELHAHHGEDSAVWKDALDGMHTLAWSVRPKSDLDERKRFLETLPGLIRRLEADLRAMSHPGSERERFFADLVTCHAEAVKAEDRKSVV